MNCNRHTHPTTSIGNALIGATHGETIGQSILDFLLRLRQNAARRRARARRRFLNYQTEREIAGLSPEIRKDIGWPQRRHELED